MSLISSDESQYIWDVELTQDMMFDRMGQMHNTLTELIRRGVSDMADKQLMGRPRDY